MEIPNVNCDNAFKSVAKVREFTMNEERERRKKTNEKQRKTTK